MDRIYLESISSQYLIPDPTWLPSESIHFFYVDKKWLSAMIDGALSVANYLDKDDYTRQNIKAQVLNYLNNVVHPDIKYPPQVSLWSFFLRSVAVDAFRDLVIRAPLPDETDQRAEVLRQINIRRDVMLCLLDRSPEDLQSLAISQPSHQQCLVFCQDGGFTDQSLKVEIKKVFSIQTSQAMAPFPETGISSEGKTSMKENMRIRLRDAGCT